MNSLSFRIFSWVETKDWEKKSISNLFRKFLNRHNSKFNLLLVTVKKLISALVNEQIPKNKSSCKSRPSFLLTFLAHMITIFNAVCFSLNSPITIQGWHIANFYESSRLVNHKTASWLISHSQKKGNFMSLAIQCELMKSTYYISIFFFQKPVTGYWE